MPASPAPNSEYTYYAADHPVVAQTITASGNTAGVSGYGKARDLILQVVVASIGGTSPNYTFSVEGSVDGTNWYSVGALSAITANGTAALTVTNPLPDNLRVKWVVTGTTPTAVVDAWIATKTIST